MTGSKVQRPASRPAPKPANRQPSRPAERPAPKPAAKPAQRPSVQKPAARPDTRPANRPGGNDGPGNNRPGDDRPGGDNRPGGNENRPGNNNRPGGGNNNNKPMPRPDRPDGNRPSTLPGMVTYPNRPGKDNPNRPGQGNRPGDNRPGQGNRPNNNLPGMGNNRPGNNRPDRDGPDRVNTGDRGGNRTNIDNSRDRNNNRFGNNNRNVHIDNVNVGRRNNGLNRPGTLPADRRNWDNNRWGGNRGVWGNQVNIQNNIRIDNNFRNNNNYAYRPNAWGARPWWGAGECHGWHHGHWNYGYSSRYYSSHWYYHDNDFAQGFMWGIAAWSLGNAVYNMGYQSYSNPYPAPPVQYNTYNYNNGGGTAAPASAKSAITYSEPVSVTAAKAPPGDEEQTKLAETKSADAVDQSRDAFKTGDYVAALKSCDEAIAYTPGDVTLHEYRALVLFALGRYSDAAGVMNPVLASGPGWGWDTMVGFYDSSATYDGQLRKLESYVKGKPDGADGHFLLGYHYLVCGHVEKAYEQFSITAKLQPADSVSRELRDLMKSSLPDAGGEDAPTAPEATPPPAVPSEKLVGTWVATPSGGGQITFRMEQDGNFVWSFKDGETASEMKGTYGLNDKGLLVLTSEDSQMVSVISLPQDTELKFNLIGMPDGDPGLDFKKG